MGIKEALGLGMELSGFFIASYLVHPKLSDYFNFDQNLTLTGLLALSLIFWTAHAFYYFEKRASKH